MGLVSLYLMGGMRFIYNGHANEGGLYQITNQTNGRVYIGCTSQFKVRWAAHHYRLLKGNHRNPFLQNDFNKCGAGAFTIEVVAVILDRESRYKAEGELIRQHFGDACYNLRAEIVTPPLMSPTTRERLRQSHIGLRYPDRKRPPPVTGETRAKLGAAVAKLKANGGSPKWGAAQRGVPRTDAVKAKLRASVEKRRLEGVLTMSNENKEKLRQTHLGKKMSDETKEKLRQANTGKVYGPRSEETRAKLRKAWESRERKGTPMSEETKEKIRRAKMGVPHTEETKAKMRASRNAYLLRTTAVEPPHVHGEDQSK